MKIHIVTIGAPKLDYARQGFAEYTKRLGRLHDVRVTHIADKHNDAKTILEKTTGCYRVALVIDASQQTSQALATQLEKYAHLGKEVSFIIGGPEGLPDEVIQAADTQWSLSALTFPHDMAMVVLAEALYRASTIAAGHPYHRE